MNTTKATIALLSVAVATAFAGSAFAQGKETGGYVGLGVGQAKAKDACEAVSGAGFSSSCDDTATAWKIYGGYKFNRYLAAEAAYTDLGKTTATVTVPAAFGGGSVSNEVKSNAWELVAVGSYPIGTSGFAPYGKAGFYRGESKGSGSVVVAGTTVSASAKETNNDFTFGLGVRYDFLRNFGVRAEWQRYNADTDIDVFSVGFQYNF